MLGGRALKVPRANAFIECDCHLRSIVLRSLRQRGDTALHRAAAAGRLACVKALLDALPTDASARLLNAVNASGGSPLVQALGSSHGRVALLLCSRGADPDAIPARMQTEVVGPDMMNLMRRAADQELDEI